MRLLVVEDERALCETIVRSLRRLAYSVDYCCDGEKAQELLVISMPCWSKTSLIRWFTWKYTSQ